MVWGSSLTQENKNDLERTQKCFAKLILRKQYKTESEESYENALLKLNLETLESRRNFLYLEFSNNCIKNGKLNDLLERNEKIHPMDTRHHEEFANTERLKKSSIIHMQHFKNAEQKQKKH